MEPEETCELLCLDAAKAEAIRAALPDLAELGALAEATKALSDPTRLGLALALAEGGEQCVCDIAFVAGRQDKIVSHHLRQLRAAGLARSRKDGRMVLYELTEAGEALVAAVAGAQVGARR